MVLMALLSPALGVQPAHAGTAPDSERSSPYDLNDFTGSLSAGYDSHYIFRGTERGKDSVWTQMEFTIPETPLNVGAWFQKPFSASPLNPSKSSELDLWALLNVEFFDGTLSLGAIGYLIPDGDAPDRFETAVEYSQTLGPVDVRFSVARDFRYKGWFFETGVAKSFSMTDRIRFDASAGLSYQWDYFANGGSWNHVGLNLAMPISLSESFTIEPYIGATFALEAIDDYQDDQLFGGVSFILTF
ncbi:MAG: TorF family putative porin [Verrucomicrobiales bacterium]